MKGSNEIKKEIEHLEEKLVGVKNILATKAEDGNMQILKQRIRAKIEVLKWVLSED